MASIRKKSGRYYARFYDKRRSPKRKELALGTSRKDVARRKLSDLERQHREGSFDPWDPDTGGTDRLTLDEAAEQFMQSRSHLRDETRDAYKYAVKGLLDTAPTGLFVGDVKPHHVRPYVKDSGVSSATRKHRRGHLSVFFNWCIDEGLLEENPCEQIHVAKQSKKVPEYLTPKQLKRLLRAIEADVEMKEAEEGRIRDGQVTWLKDVILLAVNTGLRRGELCALKWANVNLDSGFVTIRSDEDFQTKSGDERAIPLSEEATDILRRLHTQREAEAEGHSGPTGYVLRGYHGGQLNAEYASKQFKKYVRLAKLPESISFHNLRHTCASWMVQRGVSLPVVQAVLGHSDVKVTQKYAHLAPDVMKAGIQQAFDDPA